MTLVPQKLARRMVTVGKTPISVQQQLTLFQESPPLIFCEWDLRTQGMLFTICSNDIYTPEGLREAVAQWLGIRLDLLPPQMKKKVKIELGRAPDPLGP